jgi:hypothetical protein
LFQALFSLAGDDLAGPGRRERDRELLDEAWQVARTDLTLTMWPYPDGHYGGALEYASALYDEATATRLAGQFGTLAARFAADPDLAIGAATRAGSDPAALSPHQDTILAFVRDLLQRRDIGPHDDVLACGGNSLLATRLLWNVETTFGVAVPMRAFFDRPTAAGLADEVERLIRAELDAVPQYDEGTPDGRRS